MFNFHSHSRSTCDFPKKILELTVLFDTKNFSKLLKNKNGRKRRRLEEKSSATDIGRKYVEKIEKGISISNLHIFLNLKQ